jgi:hypothetical protein
MLLCLLLYPHKPNSPTNTTTTHTHMLAGQLKERRIYEKRAPNAFSCCWFHAGNFDRNGVKKEKSRVCRKLLIFCISLLLLLLFTTWSILHAINIVLFRIFVCINILNDLPVWFFILWPRGNYFTFSPLDFLFDLAVEFYLFCLCYVNICNVYIFNYIAY